MKCDICNENRGIQKCHIIPRALDWFWKGKKAQFGSTIHDLMEANTLFLCPNHHWYFDHNLLTQAEADKIKEHIGIMVQVYKDYIKHLEGIFGGRITKEQGREVFNGLIRKNKTLNRLEKEGYICLQEENKSL